ncbi:unnamed protein product [Rotaria sp. Silwood1]|nr:unnamed protein product [Rotaria sp. Silwood1]
MILIEKSLLTTKYGVAGLLIYNDGSTPERYPPASGRVHPDTTFPALSLSYQTGTNLVNAAGNLITDACMRIIISTTKFPSPVGSICAHTVAGDATQTIVIGSHSNSVPAGSGINDDGSGSATNLILATNLARLFQSSSYPPYKYRVEFCYELGGGSDYASFLTAGIVISGLNAGVSDVKTKEERDYYDQMFGQGKGGIAGVTYDHCYHDFCDSLANINPLVHYKLTQAAAYVLEYLGRHDDLRLYLYPQSEIQQLERLLLHKSTRKYNAQTEFYKKN